MMTSAYAIGFSGLLLLLLCPVGRLAPNTRIALLIAGWIIVAIELNGVSLTMALRGITGDLSIFSVYWLACAAAARISNKPALIPARQVYTALATVGIGALILYPATLGLSQWDPYRLGYGMSLPLGCGLIIALLFVLEQRFTAMAMSLALLAYALRLLESENLWDYLLDPWLTGYALYRLARIHIGNRRKRNSVSPDIASAA